MQKSKFNKVRNAAASCAHVRNRNRLLASTALGAVLVMTAAPGHAADRTWIGSTSNDWFTGTNWTGNAAPAAGDNVIISSGSAVVNNDTPTLGSVTVSNSGSLTKTSGEFTNQGTFTVSSGGTVNFSGGTVTKVDGGTLLSPDRLIVTGSGSTFTDPNGIIIGDTSVGEVTLADSGKLSAPSVTLANQSGSTGVLNIGAARNLAAAAAGTLDASTIIFGAGDGRVEFNHTATNYIFSSSMTGNGSVYADSGTTRLTADSSGFSGLVNVAGGELNVAGKLGFGNVSIANDSTLRVSGTLSGNNSVISNPAINVAFGTLLIENGGSVSSDYTQIGSLSSAKAIVTGAGSSLSITNLLSVGSVGNSVQGFIGHGTLQIEDGAAVSADGVRIGSLAAPGDVFVTGENASLNASVIYLGGDGASNGSDTQVGTLTVANHANVTTSNLRIATQTNGTGTLNIGAAAGSAPVAPGTLDTAQVSFGLGTGKIVFNHTAADYVFAPVIASNGGGGEVDVYSGTTTLTAANTYTGPTNVNGGTLLVNGSIASSSVTSVNAGGTLGGTGTVGNTTVASGGTFAPGSGLAGSSMTVQGSLAFQSGAQYLVRLDPSVASSASVTGTATLTDARVNAVFAPGSYIEKQYTILTADGGLGNTKFASISGAPANFASTLSYDANNVYLDLNLFQPSNLTGLNQNQRAVAHALSNSFNAVGGIPMAFGTLTPQGLTQASGELATGSQQATFDAMNMFMGVMTDPFVAGRSSGTGASVNTTSQYADDSDTHKARDAYAAIYRKAPIQTFEKRWSVWGAAYGGSQTTTGNSITGSNTATSNIYGVAAGADYHLSPDTLVGFALAGGGTNFNVAGSGSGRSDLFQAGAFLRHEMGPAYITAAMAYGWQNITTDRTVTAAGVDRLHASFDANAFSGRVESGYRFISPVFGGIGLTPYAAGQVTLFDLPSYAEQALSGSNQFALSYGSKDATATRSELGLRGDKSFALNDAILTLRGRAAWAHNFDSDRSTGATFQTLPGASFVVNGAAQASDSALVTASSEVKWLNGWSVAGTFEGEFSSVTNSYAGKGVVRYAW